MADTPQLTLNPRQRIPLLKSQASAPPGPEPQLPITQTHTHPGSNPSHSTDSGSVYFIGNATTIIEWHGARFLTDPNFLHAGYHVHLGPGVSAMRLHDPIVDMDALPGIDCVLLSHYHEDHFDREVEAALNRDFPIVTTPHAKKCLEGKEEPFHAVRELDTFQSLVLPVTGQNSESMGKKPVVKITAMPGKHVPPGPLVVANELLGAVPPTNGWMVEMGFEVTEGEVQTGYRIYISGDTLFVDELREIPRWLRGERIDLMLVHLGGTSIPGPNLPLLMVTMDAAQGVRLMKLVDPKVTVPIHFDDYSVMVSGLDDFKRKVEAAGLGDRAVYLDRGDEYRFSVKG